MYRKIFVVFILAMTVATVAYAGPLGTIKAWITGEIAQLILAGIAGILTIALGILMKKFGDSGEKVKQTFKETAEFIDVVGAAIADDKISKEELKNIVEEGKDIYEVWL